MHTVEERGLYTPYVSQPFEMTAVALLLQGVASPHACHPHRSACNAYFEVPMVSIRCARCSSSHRDDESIPVFVAAHTTTPAPRSVSVGRMHIGGGSSGAGPMWNSDIYVSALNLCTWMWGTFCAYWRQTRRTLAPDRRRQRTNSKKVKSNTPLDAQGRSVPTRGVRFHCGFRG